MLLSIVSPVYKAEKIIDELVKRLTTTLTAITEDYEIILVDDRSPDNGWDKIQEWCKADSRIKGIRLSRNFGQHYAISAGLDHVKGEWVVVMDCDLQDAPESIPDLYKKAQEGYDLVVARREDRKDHFFKRSFSRLFNRVLSYLTGTEYDEAIANFGIYNKRVIDQIRGMRESIRYFPTMVKWVGFHAAEIVTTHAERFEGNSSYNFRRLLHLALNIILAYSDKPLRLCLKFGLSIAGISFLFACFNFIKWLSGSITEPGFTSIIISIWFLSGCILFTIGVAGLYIGKTFEQARNRPIYILDKTINI